MLSQESSLEPVENQENQQPNGSNGHVEPTELAAKTLTGDLRDGLWRILQDYGLLLNRDEAGQRRIADAISTETHRLVAEAVKLIAGRDFPSIGVALEQVSFEPKGIKLKMAMSGLDQRRRHELVDMQNKIVMLVLADPSSFMGARGSVEVQAPPGADGEESGKEPELPLTGEPGDSLDKIEADAAAIVEQQQTANGEARA